MGIWRLRVMESKLYCFCVLTRRSLSNPKNPPSYSINYYKFNNKLGELRISINSPNMPE